MEQQTKVDSYIMEMVNDIVKEGVDKVFAESVVYVFVQLKIDDKLHVKEFAKNMSRKLKYQSNFDECSPFFKEIIQLGFFWKYQINQKFSFDLQSPSDRRFVNYISTYKFEKMVNILCCIKDIYDRGVGGCVYNEVSKEELIGGGSRDDDDELMDKDIGDSSTIDYNDVEQQDGNKGCENVTNSISISNVSSLEHKHQDSMVSNIECVMCAANDQLETKMIQYEATLSDKDRCLKEGGISLNPVNSQIMVVNVDPVMYSQIIGDDVKVEEAVKKKVYENVKKRKINDGLGTDDNDKVDSPLIIGGDQHTTIESRGSDIVFRDEYGRIVKRRKLNMSPGRYLNLSTRILTHDLVNIENTRRKINSNVQVTSVGGVEFKEKDKIDQIAQVVSTPNIRSTNSAEIDYVEEKGDNHRIFIYDKGLYFNSNYPKGLTTEEFGKMSSVNYSYVIKSREKDIIEIFKDQKVLVLNIELIMINVSKHKYRGSLMFNNFMNMGQSLKLITKVTIKGRVYYFKEGLDKLLEYLIHHDVNLYLVSYVSSQAELECLAAYILEVNGLVRYKGCFSYVTDDKGVVKYDSKVVFYHHIMTTQILFDFFNSKVDKGKMVYLDCEISGVVCHGGGYFKYPSYDLIMSTFRDDVVYVDIKLIVSTLGKV